MNHRQPLRSPAFRLLWTGQTLSQLGDACYDVALVWLALQLMRQDPLAVGVVVFARAIPYLLFGLLGGAYADRWDRRRTMVLCDIARAFVVLLIPLAALLGVLAFWQLALVAFVLTSLRAVFHPSLQAAVPQVVPDQHLVSANAILHASLQATSVLGPVAAGFLLTLLPPEYLFAFDALTFLFSALTLFAIRFAPAAEAAPAEHASVIRELLDAVRCVREQPVLFWCITLFGVGLLAIAGVYRIGLPLFADQVLNGGPQAFGLLLGSLGLGNIIGALATSRLRVTSATRAGALVFVAWILWGGLFALLGLSQTLPAAIVLVGLAGIGSAPGDVMLTSLIQRGVPPHLLGKVFSFWSTLAFIGDSASALLIGFLMARLAPVPVFVGASLVAAAIGVFGLIQVLRIERSGSTAHDVHWQTARQEPA